MVRDGRRAGLRPQARLLAGCVMNKTYGGGRGGRLPRPDSVSAQASFRQAIQALSMFAACV